MSYLLDVKEILEFAVYIEERGYEFYVGAMKKFSEAQGHRAFPVPGRRGIQAREVLQEADGAERRGGEGEQRPRIPGLHEGIRKAHSSWATARRSTAKLARVSEPGRGPGPGHGFRKGLDRLFFRVEGNRTPGAVPRPVEKVIHEEMGHLRKIFQMKRELVKK